MKMTLEKFDEKVRQAESQREALSREIEALAKQESELSAACQTAIDSGNVDLYIEKSSEKEKVSKTLFVKRSFLSKIGSPVTADDAREAWNDYVSTHNKTLAKAINEFNAERDKLLKAYKALVDMQSAALKMRDHLNDVVGLSNPEKAFPMEYIPCISSANDPGAVSFGRYNVSDPDLIYYLSALEKAAGYSVRSPLTADKQASKEADQLFNTVVRHSAK